ncbi:MAG: DUF3810 family protein [Christensenellales bacterium]|jgi:hypothetical protein|nr:DUF3810 domain-containing protein [Clostridiales bacterium]
MKLKHKKIVNRAIVVAVLATLIVILSLLKTNAFIREYVFVRGWSRAYIYLASNITSVFPFSVFEVLIYLIIITLIWLIVRWSRLLSRRKGTKVAKEAMNLLIALMVVILLYTSTASFSYYRDPLPLPLYQGEQLNEQQTEEIIRYHFDEFRKASDMVKRDDKGKVVLPYSFSELNEILIAEYKRIGSLNGYLMEYTPRVKKIGASMVMNYQGFTGVAVTPTGEANINKHTPVNYLILTMAHELAHIKGIMNENEANLIAYYLALTSDNIYLKYAGYMYTAGRLLEMAYFAFDPEKFSEMCKLYPEQADKEYEMELSFWDQFVSPLEKISEFINDLYLKSSGLEEGTGSYIDSSEKEVIINPETGNYEYVMVEYSPMQKALIEIYLANK